MLDSKARLSTSVKKTKGNNLYKLFHLPHLSAMKQGIKQVKTSLVWPVLVGAGAALAADADDWKPRAQRVAIRYRGPFLKAALAALLAIPYGCAPIAARLR
jgi:hypothetical protein